jgi:ABC-type transport system involved in multi-copper enzyme maturation permease subunit
MSLDATFDQSRNLMAPILAVFGDVDLSFVVKIILSLFVILLTYDAISGEKERGTLKLTLANDISRSTVILGKILGGFSVILVAFILPLLLGLAFMMGFYPDIIARFTTDVWIRLFIIIGVYILYLGVFFAVGLFVSALSQKSATSFIILLMVWVLFVAIIPRLSLTVAERIQPYESYVSLQTKANKEIGALRQERIAEYNQERWLKAFQEGEFAQMFAEMFDKMNELQQDIMSKYDTQFVRQQNSQITLAEVMARSLSPTSALSFALQNLAGSGYERQKEYVQQMRGFQKEFRANILDKIRTAELKTQQEIQEFFSQDSLDVSQQLVRFEFKEENLGTVVTRALPDIAVLAILAMLFFTASFVAFIRYDVR